jgi:CheY-specific phosphatase CheX
MLQKLETICSIRKLKVPTKTEINEFSEMISKSVSEMGGTHMDAIIHHCEQTGMEVDVASSLISSALKAKIREEAQDLNLLKKSSKLPL